MSLLAPVWNLVSAPGPNVIATLTRAGTSGKANILTAIHATVASDSNYTTPLAASSNTTTAGALTATLAASSSYTTYITGFVVTGTGATAASTILITVTGVTGGPLNYYLTIPAGAGAAMAPLSVSFPTPIPATAANTAVVVNVPSFGAGNTTAAVAATGFRSAGPVTTDVVIRDGASGSGAILWNSSLSLAVTAGQMTSPLVLQGIAIVGTPGNAMTVEFQAAMGPGTSQVIAVTGFTEL